MTASLATLLIMAAAFLVMFSGALGDEGGKRARARAGTLILIAVLMVIAQPFCVALLHAVPWYVVIGTLIVVSLAAFAIVEARRAGAPRVPQRTFVSYRGSGKVPAHEEEPPLAAREDSEAGAERDELL
jgi:MFS family permease